MKEIIFTICLLFSCIILYATEPVAGKDGKTEKSTSFSTFPTYAPQTGIIYQEKGFYFDVSPGISFIKNSKLSSDTWKSESNIGYNFNLGYFYSMSTWAKIKMGLGFSSYSTYLKMGGEITSPALNDIDNDTYFESLTLSNVEYDVNPMYITVPVVFEFGNPNISKIGYYFDIGFEYSYLINENNKTSGTYTTKGIYPQWGVTLENIPELGFYTSKSLEPNWHLRKSNYSIKGGAGITIPLSGMVIFKIGLTGYLGLKDIGNNRAKKDDASPLSQQAYDFRSKYINNPLATSKGSKTLYTGIEFGFYISKHVK